MPLLSARNLSKAYGPQTLFSEIALTVRRGDRVGLLGANGTGKSTFLRVLAGLEPSDNGVIDRRRGARILYLPQEPELAADATPRDIVAEGLADWHKTKMRHDEVARILESGAVTGHELTKLLEEQAHLGEAIEHLGGWDRGHIVVEMLERLGVREIDRPVGNMSGGERRRVALARVLVASPDLAILDEPTNHLDAATIEWLETFMASTFGGALLLVTHDRYFLDQVATRIVELENGNLTEYTGNYETFLDKKAEAMEQADRVESNRQNLVRREQAWLRRGAKARSTKQKARIQRAEAVIAIDAPKERERARLEGMASGRLGGTILEFRDVSAAVPEGGRTLFDHLTLHMVAGDRIGIIGPNGSGKTSLLKLISGEAEPLKGEVVRGTRTKLAYFDQARANLMDDWSIYDNVAEREGAERTGGGQVDLGVETIDLRVYLERFLFEIPKQRQKVGALSGGERARVALAKMLKGGANLLLLDEPTNDLDVQTLGALEEMLETWKGCAIVVSHDRYFLNNVATSILAFEPSKTEPGRAILTRYQGNYDTYRSLKAEAEAALAAAAPAPVKGASSASGAPAAGAKSEVATSGKGAASADLKPLTYTERKELETIFDTIGEAEDAVAAAEKKLSDPTIYSRPEEARTLQASLEKAQLEVARVTARWEDLEARRDAKR